MALKTVPKATTAPELVAQNIDTRGNLEDMIADQLLDDVDWSRVRSAMLNKAKSRLFAWLVSGNDTPVTLSPYPELAVLPSADEQEKAA